MFIVCTLTILFSVHLLAKAQRTLNEDRRTLKIVREDKRLSRTRRRRSK